MTRTTGYFLWVGSTLSDIARVSVLSAAEAGFDTVLFTDRPQDIAHPNLRTEDYRDIDLPWSPEDIRLKGQNVPCYAAFSDLFRFALLAYHDGWWFDCDTLILRPADDFTVLSARHNLVVGNEGFGVVNGAVLGSSDTTQMDLLKDEAARAFPILSRWGIVGPALITRMIAERRIDAHVVSQAHFYPVHHNDIADIYDPQHRDALRAREPDWYCLSLWGEVLSRSGLKHLAPPPGSYLADLLDRHPALGPITGDPAAMARFLRQNLRRLDDLDSGRIALGTLRRKLTARLGKR